MRRAIVVVAAAVVVAVAGCGGAGRLSKQQFETHVQRDALLAAKALANSSTAAGRGPQGYARRVGIAQAQMHRAAEDLDGISPPKDAAAGTQTIVRALRFLDRQLTKLHHAAATQNVDEAQAVSAAIGESAELRALDDAARDLQRKGYDVGVFGR